MLHKFGHQLLEACHGDIQTSVWPRQQYPTSFTGASRDCVTSTGVQCQSGGCPSNLGGATCGPNGVCQCPMEKCFVAGKCVELSCKEEAETLGQEISKLKEEVADTERKAGLPEQKTPPSEGTPTGAVEQIKAAEDIKEFLRNSSYQAQQAAEKTAYAVDMSKKSAAASNNAVSMSVYLIEHPEARKMADLQEMGLCPPDVTIAIQQLGGLALCISRPSRKVARPSNHCRGRRDAMDYRFFL